MSRFLLGSPSELISILDVSPNQQSIFLSIPNLRIFLNFTRKNFIQIFSDSNYSRSKCSPLRKSSIIQLIVEELINQFLNYCPPPSLHDPGKGTVPPNPSYLLLLKSQPNTTPRVSTHPPRTHSKRAKKILKKKPDPTRSVQPGRTDLAHPTPNGEIQQPKTHPPTPSKANPPTPVLREPVPPPSHTHFPSLSACLCTPPLSGLPVFALRPSPTPSPRKSSGSAGP